MDAGCARRKEIADCVRARKRRNEMVVDALNCGLVNVLLVLPAEVDEGDR